MPALRGTRSGGRQNEASSNPDPAYAGEGIAERRSRVRDVVPPAGVRAAVFGIFLLFVKANVKRSPPPIILRGIGCLSSRFLRNGLERRSKPRAEASATSIRQHLRNVFPMDGNADIEKKLQCWDLLSRFRKMLEQKLADHPLSKTELDPRRELSCLDYYGSILFTIPRGKPANAKP